MDAKALAKSKRAHTQHHKKQHPNQKPKATLIGGGDVKKVSGNQVAEKSQKPRGSPALPSNWDRYADEFGSDGEDFSGLPPDVTLPKSKGADYRHLISESRAQADLTMCSDSFPALDNDFLGDLSWGLGALLSVRGEGMLSRAEDDNFIVDDKDSANYGASLISLNLHALAERLEKVDLSERLFIEAEILPPELCSKSNANCSADQTETVRKNATDTSRSEELVSIDSLDRRSSPDPISDEGLISVDHIDIDPGQDSKADHSKIPLAGRINAQESTTLDGNFSTFETTAAESELDMLLGSFSEVAKLDSSGLRSVPQHFGKGMDSSSRGNDLDDALDNLLDETSNTLRDMSFSQLDVPRPTCNFPSSSKQEASTATLQSRKGTDTFELAIADGNFEDDLDALLEETSNTANLNGSTQPQKIDAPHSTQPSSSISSESKVKDDFDSWLDTL